MAHGLGWGWVGIKIRLPLPQIRKEIMGSLVRTRLQRLSLGGWGSVRVGDAWLSINGIIFSVKRAILR